METAFIKQVEYLKKRDWLRAFLFNKNRIPIVYEYAQKTSEKKTSSLSVRTKDEIESNSIIGYATNIRKDGTDVICDVELISANSLSNNFTGIIDNYVLKVNGRCKGGEPKYDIVRFIVYDKEFKRKVDEMYARRIQEPKEDQ